MNYYSITVKVMFGVMADSTEDAESIASSLTDGMEDEIPSRAIVSVDAYLTPNQAPDVQRGAVNFQEPA
jgi:hypothetical protein